MKVFSALDSNLGVVFGLSNGPCVGFVVMLGRVWGVDGCLRTVCRRTRLPAACCNKQAVPYESATTQLMDWRLPRLEIEDLTEAADAQK